jgi:short-subunit dehydrogenase
MSNHIWITGAGSGIGEALALRFATQGDFIHASGRDRHKLDRLVAKSSLIQSLPLDITDHQAVMAAVQSLPEIDIAILNAGTHMPTPATSFDRTAHRLIETNLMGTLSCVEAILPRMIQRGSGHLVLVASVAGYRGLPTAAGYCASKAGVIALAESLRLDLQGTGVRVTLVNPGFVDTPLTRKNDFAMPDIITADQAAQIILDGLKRNRFEIAFPTRFALGMKLLRIMPDFLYFPLVKRITRS